MSEPTPVAVVASAGNPIDSSASEETATSPLAEESGPAFGENPAGSACPPPLVWQEVLAAYRAESLPWQIEHGSRQLTGRTWGDGPSLYLLNGFAGTSELYSLMIWLLRDSFRCVVMDTATVAGSRRKQLTMNDYASDLIAAADYHGDSLINVFGASFGAAQALQASLDYPDRIARLALQHGFALRKLSWFERQLARSCSWSRRSLSALPGRRRIQELNHRRWFPPFDGTRFQFLLESTGQIPLVELAQRAMAVHKFDVRQKLQDVSCPVMLVRTEGQGTLENEGHELLERGLRDTRTEWLHSSGLHPYLTHPHRLAKLLKAFFLPPESST